MKILLDTQALFMVVGWRPASITNGPFLDWR